MSNRTSRPLLVHPNPILTLHKYSTTPYLAAKCCTVTFRSRELLAGRLNDLRVAFFVPLGWSVAVLFLWSPGERVVVSMQPAAFFMQLRESMENFHSESLFAAYALFPYLSIHLIVHTSATNQPGSQPSIVYHSHSVLRRGRSCARAFKSNPYTNQHLILTPGPCHLFLSAQYSPLRIVTPVTHPRCPLKIQTCR